MVKRVCLVRHGETEWTRIQRLQGQINVELAEDGYPAILSLGRWLKTWHFDYVISSDLVRCTKTAELLGFSNFETSAGWRETDAGDWSGRLFSEVEEEIPNAMSLWAEDKLSPEGGETPTVFIQRLRHVVDTLVSRSEEVVLVVSHAAVIREVTKLLLGLEGYVLNNPDPASLTVIDLGDRPKLRMYNVNTSPIELNDGNPIV